MTITIALIGAALLAAAGIYLLATTELPEETHPLPTGPLHD